MILNEGRFTPEQTSVENTPSVEVDGDVRTAQQEVVACLQLISHKIYDLTSYSYLTLEGERDFLMQMRVFVQWFSYLREQLSLLENNQVFPTQVHLLSTATAYLIDYLQADELVGRSDNGAFNYQDYSSNRSSYGRSKPTEIKGTSFHMISANDFFLNDEIDYIFSHSPGLFSGDISTLIEHVTKQDSNKIYVDRKFADETEVRQFLKDLAEKIQEKGFEKKTIIIEVQVALNDEIRVWRSFYYDNNEKKFHFSMVGATIFYGTELGKMTFPPSALPKVEIWKAVIDEQTQRFTNDNLEKKVENMEENLKGRLKYGNRLTELKLSMQDQHDIFNNDWNAAQEFAHEDPLTAVFQILQSMGFPAEKWKKKLLYKRAIKYNQYDQADAGGKQEFLSQILEKHRERYAELFSDPTTPQKPDIFFTKSGTSANRAAFLLAQQLLHPNENSPQPTCHVHNGWYFESTTPENWQQTSIDEAQILCISLDPNPPQLTQDETGYQENLYEVVENFLQHVDDFPNEQFVLIVDKTTDLLDHVYFPKSVRPNNLTIIETASITKHQRDGKAHFFGTIAVWGDDIDTSLAESSVTGATGQLSPDGVFSLPRLTRPEVEKNLEHNQQLAEVFSQTFEQYQQKLKPKYRWQWQPYNYFGFVIPPPQLLKEYFENQKLFLQSGTDGETLKSSANIFFKNHPNQDQFDKGDSYGLAKTRLTLFSVPYPYPSKLSKRDYVLNLRIGFGNKTDLESMRIFAEEFCQHLIEKTSDIIGPRSLHKIRKSLIGRK